MKQFLLFALTGISFFSFISVTQATSPIESSSQEVIETDDYTTEIIYLEQLHAMQLKLKKLKETIAEYIK